MYTLGVGISIYVLSLSIFWVVPFFGTSLIFALIVTSLYILIKCAFSIWLDFYFAAVPLGVGFIVGFVVYNVAGVSMTRETYFFWPKSWLLDTFHVIVTSLVSAFLLVNGIMYFSSPYHNSPMAILVSQLGPSFGECVPIDSIVACGTIFAAAIIICLSRTRFFEEVMQTSGFTFFQVHEEVEMVSRLTSPVSSEPDPEKEDGLI